MRHLRLVFLVLIICGPVFAQAPIDKGYLDVTISVFDVNLHGSYPEVRRAEARYIPAYLQLGLIESDTWGAVRMLPSTDSGAELSITGKIIDSDGSRLSLEVLAKDSSGRIWVEKTYSGEAIESVSIQQSGLGPEPFDAVYREITRDLAAMYTQLSPADVNLIKTLSQLKYAASLSPEIFAPYLQRNENGIYEIIHLPATNDPNIQRIREIREHEYLFIDVVNEKYYSFIVNIKPVYDLWRSYRRQQLADEAYVRELKANNDYELRRGSYWAIRESYDNFRWAKMEQQYLDDIHERFRNEILSTDITLKDSLYQLNGALEDQYTQWKQILKEIYELEN